MPLDGHKTGTHLTARILEPRRVTKAEKRLKETLLNLQKKRDILGMLRLEPEALELAKKCEEDNPKDAVWIMNLFGVCYYSTGDYVRARELQEQHRAMAEALGDRVGVARACGNLGSCYHTTGDYGRARELQEQARALCEALGDRAGVARACGNLGLCDYRTGDYGRARELHEQCKAISEALGDRAGVAWACGNLGNCGLNTGDYGRAISYFTEQHAIAKEIQVVHGQAKAALGVGVALRLEVRANVRGRAAGASELPGSPACRDDGVREAEKWLQTAVDLGRPAARLHLAHLAFDAGSEEMALAHLEDYLSWCVEQGRNRCAGCFQTRGEDAQMLTCGGCRVARFCSADHQKMASKSVASGGSLLEVRHKDVCGLLSKWRLEVVKRAMPPETLRMDLIAFLSK
jgi:tetratricopeptide (TPR) repeat protein